MSQRTTVAAPVGDANGFALLPGRQQAHFTAAREGLLNVNEVRVGEGRRQLPGDGVQGIARLAGRGKEPQRHPRLQLPPVRRLRVRDDLDGIPTFRNGHDALGQVHGRALAAAQVGTPVEIQGREVDDFRRCHGESAGTCADLSRNAAARSLRARAAFKRSGASCQPGSRSTRFALHRQTLASAFTAGQVNSRLRPPPSVKPCKRAPARRTREAAGPAVPGRPGRADTLFRIE